MKTYDYDEIVRELNILLDWARARVDSKESCGAFSFNISPRVLDTKRASTTLYNLLKDLGYVKRAGGSNSRPVYWVKPDGHVTLEEFKNYKTALQEARAAVRGTNPLATENVQLKKQIADLKAALRELRADINRALKP